MRYFMDISYLGTNYHGWQIQPNGITVQEEIEKALSTILKQKLSIIGSGRTDAGVHASQQVAHFDFSDEIDTLELTRKLNSFLGNDIAIKSIRKVDENVHARFSAISRTYHYYINSEKNPFNQGQSYFFKPALKTAEIHKACKILMDWENFECFSKVHTEVNHFRCDIQVAKWYRIGAKNFFVITADRFLRGMVRAIVGTLLDIVSNSSSVIFSKPISSNSWYIAR
ncbi:MAG: tRNA pseudouridine(38-40) synthase TruA, partial [Bacteroidota bacterium]